MIAASLLLGLALASGQAQAPSGAKTPDARPEKAVAWERELRRTFADVASNLVIDLPELRAPVPTVLPGSTLPALRRFGWSLDREVAERGETYLLLRPDLSASMEERGYTGPLLDALQGLDSPLLRRLGEEGARVDELPVNVQRLLIRTADGHPTLVSRMIRGETVGIGVYADAEGTDAEGRFRHVRLAEPNHRMALAAVERPVPADRKEETPLKTPIVAGEMKFLEGEVMSLDALATRIRATWRTNLDFDIRLAPTLVFLKGSFSKGELLPLALAIAAPKTPVVETWSRSSRVPKIESIMNKLGTSGRLAGREGLGSVTDDDIRNRRSYSLEELASASPSFAFRSSQGWKPGTEFRLARRLSVSLFTPGQGTTTPDSMNWVIDP